jgi:hypothetical protein
MIGNHSNPYVSSMDSGCKNHRRAALVGESSELLTTVRTVCEFRQPRLRHAQVRVLERFPDFFAVCERSGIIPPGTYGGADFDVAFAAMFLAFVAIS